MSENSKTEFQNSDIETCYRPLRIDDLFDEIKPVQNNYSNRNNTYNIIEKNQKEFGNKKRIKP